MQSKQVWFPEKTPAKKNPVSGDSALYADLHGHLHPYPCAPCLMHARTHTHTHMNYKEKEEEERGKEEEMRRQTKIYTQRSSQMIQISLSKPSFSP